MNRLSLPSAILLLAACGGTRGTATSGVDTLGTDRHATTSNPTMIAKADPAAAFRKTWSNPGGMWLPQQMTLAQHVELFNKLGVTLDAKSLADPLADPLGAVVSLGNCTASFVSPDGLIVTNHHCVQDALQLNSTPDSDLVKAGFLAKTRADEKSAGPAKRVMVAQAFRDVTHAMRDGLDEIADPVARKLESEKRSKALIAACEKDRPEVRCQVADMFRGGSYTLIEMLEIKDVRVVYVPARSIGNFGGEVDNWHWPRHTGDFSFLRAYVGKDGKPAEFSADNVPFHPKRYLRVSTEGVAAGDFVMVMGYPGSTNRTVTASTLHHDLEWYYPYYIAYAEEHYRLYEAHLHDAGETGIKAGVAKQGTQNGLEKFRGILDGLNRDPELLARKDALEKKVQAWAAAPGHEAYAEALTKLEAVQAEARRTARADFDRGSAWSSSRLLGTAFAMVRWAEEREKPDADRKPGFQLRDLPRGKAGQKQLVKQFDKTLDRGAFRIGLVRALALPEADRAWLPVLLDAKKGAKLDEALIDKTLDAWFAAPAILDEKLRLELIETGTLKQLRASPDPFIKAALRLWPTYKAEEKRTDARIGELMLVMPMYVEAVRQVLGGALAPDANSTLRITYGTVRSLKPDSQDPADLPLTVASQIVGKTTGTDPFDTPDAVVAAIKAKQFGPYADKALGDLPVDFESDLDITGGNSGSPTVDAKGRLVGLAFDGNREGLASDVVFDGTTTRTIHVDARYMLWTMDLIAGADPLLQEMGVTPKLP